MKFRLSLTAFVVLLCGTSMIARFSANAAPRLPPRGHQVLTMQVGGLDRQCLLHVPPGYDQSKPVPLVLMLHGKGSTATYSVRETGWSTKADTETFIVAYPEGTRPDPTRAASLRNNSQSWNDGSGRFHAGEQDIDDVAYIKALIERLTADYNIDRRRIFVAGFSNGASMTLRIGAELSDLVAAIAPGAGACWRS